MRKDRFSCGTVIFLFGCFAAGFAQANDTVADAQANAEREVSESVALETVSDPELAFVEGMTCLDIGGWEDVRPSQAPERFRGNVYRINYATNLTEVKMELQISNGAEVTLVFSFHRALSGDGLQTFERFGRPDISATVVGTGLPKVYSPGPLPTPLKLLPGYDYLLGVSWFSTAVSFGRDERPYPRSFLHGDVLGLAVQNVGPPIPDTFGPLAVFQSGAYSMELCFEPVAGACCLWTDDPDDDDCELLLESQCTETGSYFHGERAACPEVFCQFGVCCFPCGECATDYTPETCEAEGGVWFGPGAECPGDACPVVTGACCDGASCTEVCVDECEAIGGEYLGHGTTCHPNYCAGACCIVDLGCADLTQDVCDLVGGFGAFRGLGTTCASLPTDPITDECGGACCATLLGQPRCIQVERRSECSEEHGLTNPVYMGDAIICDSDPENPTCIPAPSSVACCMPDGACAVGTLDFCDDAMGFAVAGQTTCDSVTCETVCCDGGDCTMVPGDLDCVNAGGTVNVLADSCLDDPCTTPTGACCFADRSCDPDVTREVCEAEPGRFEQGLTCVRCEELGALGACCQPNGTCADLVTQEECRALGGADSNYNAGMYCDQVSCARRGACCDSVGTCFFILPEDCSRIPGGAYVGPGIACAGSTCPTGACCEENECIERTALGCEASEGKYRGDGTECDETVFCSEIPGACCVGAGDCEVLTPQCCFDGQGVFQGPLSRCSPEELCDRGACCHLDGTCGSAVVVSECTGEHDEFIPGASCAACDDRGACCLPHGKCENAVVQEDCEDPEGRNGVYDGDGTLCRPNLCVTGACCLLDGSCDDSLTQQACEDEAVGGAYQGPGTPCAPGLCIRGGCCHLDGSCDDFVVESECMELYDEFVAGFDCRDFGCLAGGACCIGGTCEDNMPEETCGLQGGTYTVDGTLCTSDLCLQGACCLPNETCDDTLTRQSCEAADGLYLGEGSVCAGTDCRRGSCCTPVGVCTDPVVPSLCDVPEDFNPGSCAHFPCVGRGACCLPDGSCAILTRKACVSQLGTYDGDATICDPEDLCLTGACCLLNGNCASKTRQRCERGAGTYVGPDVPCEAETCDLWVAGSVPPDCGIDARQPSEPDGSDTAVAQSITIIFNRRVADLRPEDFTVEVFPGPATIPVVLLVTIDEEVATLYLNQPLVPQRWTCFTHTDSGIRTCVGVLPADVNGDGMSNGDDVGALIDHLNGLADPPLGLWQCDTNRSGVCTPADLLRAIDLLNGADVYEPGWMDATFVDNEPCPNPPPKSAIRGLFRTGR